jgi:flagellar hook-associated protein 1 FlgK
MSLYSSIRLAANTLRANQIGLQVVGQNIANANTPGYIREEAVFAPTPPQRIGKLLLGTGVEVEAVVQKLDRFLEERLRGSVSDRVDAETQESSYLQLETVIGELGEGDLSTSINTFFSSIAEILNHPESIAVRNLAILQGGSLTSEINRLASRVGEIRSALNDRVIGMAETINRLVEEIRQLNLKITVAEVGDVSASDAGGLRDQRLQALEDLAKLIDISVKEQPDGSVNVYSGGDYLVFQGVSRTVEVVLESGQGLAVANIYLTGSDALLSPASGELGGLLTARDDIMGSFLSEFDEFARTLAFEFNKLYSGGQGLTGFRELTGEFAVSDDDLALDQAGLTFTPASGSFQVMVRDKQNGTTQTTDVLVDLNGLGDDTTLADLATLLTAVNGITAGITSDGKLTISSDSPEQEFAFGADTSGVLAALGLNTFFSGSSALELGVNEVLRADGAKFAASRGGIATDTENAVELAAFLDRPIQTQNDLSLSVLYVNLIGETTQASSITRAVAEGARTFEATLRGQKLAVSGVNLDEEAVQMIILQRSFQAAARYIATLSELLEILVNL